MTSRTLLFLLLIVKHYLLVVVIVNLLLIIIQDCKLKLAVLFLGKSDFGEEEDAHVIGDCVKVLVCIYSNRSNTYLF